MRQVLFVISLTGMLRLQKLHGCSGQGETEGVAAGSDPDALNASALPSADRTERAGTQLLCSVSLTLA